MQHIKETQIVAQRFDIDSAVNSFCPVMIVCVAEIKGFRRTFHGFFRIACLGVEACSVLRDESVSIGDCVQYIFHPTVCGILVAHEELGEPFQRAWIVDIEMVHFNYRLI